MKMSEIIAYYSKPEIAAELVRYAEGREVAVRFSEVFGKRPDTLQFQQDVINAARKGATSFHCSEEKWQDPLQLAQESTKKDMDELRAGWDLIIDIDCKILEWSTICAELLLQSLKFHEVNCASLKFSGGTGWHIGVPGIALSDERLAFPETPQIIAQYLREFIRPHLADRILNHEADIKKILEKSKKKREEIFKDEKFDPFTILGIDTIAIAPRHMIRAPYSLNEKKWLASLPIAPNMLKKFGLGHAKPENIVTTQVKFLDTENVIAGEASRLLIQALDWFHGRNDERENKNEKQQYDDFTEKVPAEKFPPCMKLVLAGLPDGRKRALFALMNFLKSAKYSWPEVEAEVKAWNSKNTPPLKMGYVQAQLNWHKRQTAKFPPPNCKDYYKDIGVCKPDFTCGKIKNPISYPRFLRAQPSAKEK